MEAQIAEAIRRARAFSEAAHSILSQVETAPSRVVVLEASYGTLEKLGIQQDDLLRQALRCAEHGLFRAAHVMAWAGFMDYLQERLASDGLKKVRSLRPNWKAFTMDELREYVPERQLVEVARETGLCSKNEMNALIGLLNRRNECAHPSDYLPGLNETLGYISELLQRVGMLKKRSI